MSLLDDVKKRLVSILQEDGRISLVELGKQLSMTHVGVRKHLLKLTNKGLVKVQALLNVDLLKLNFALLIVDGDIPEKLSLCPRLVLVGRGKDRTIMMVYAEDDSTLKCVVERIRSRVGKEITEIRLTGIDKPKYMYIPLASRCGDTAPCGDTCERCMFRMVCLRCPATTHYRGPL